MADNRYDNDNYNRRRTKHIDFEDNDYDDFGHKHNSNPMPGQSESDWADPDEEHPRRATRPAQRSTSHRRQPSSNDYTSPQQQPWRKRHPVLTNLILVICAGILSIFIMLWFLDYWTFHGQERVVPDVKGQVYNVAAENIDISGLKAIVTDSIFDSYARPGTVVEQTPIAGSHVKRGGSVYLTIVAYTPKLVVVPNFTNMSTRQARSALETAGITNIREVPVPSEYEGLVIGVKFNGVNLQPGARIPASANVTIEVGSGYQTNNNEISDSNNADGNDDLQDIIDNTIDGIDFVD